MGAHSQRGINDDRSAMGLVATLIAVCVAAVLGVTIAAATGALNSTTPPAMMTATASTVTVPKDPTSTVRARAFLAETYRASVGPDVLDAHGTIIVATAVCDQSTREHVGLATLSQNIAHMIPKLTRIQAATLVDDAIKYYCPNLAGY